MVEQKVSHDLIDSSCPVSVDLAVFTLAGRELSVLLRRRIEPPYPGFWALPGGLRCPGSSLDSQARALQVGITGVDGGWIEPGPQGCDHTCGLPVVLDAVELTGSPRQACQIVAH